MLFFHSVMSYGLIFWGNSTHSKCVFKLQERTIRIIMRARNNESWTEFFKLLKILPLSAQYIYSLLTFVVNKRNLFLDNTELYKIKTRNSYKLHPPLFHLTKYQKGVHYAGIRVFNHLPTSIKSIANEIKVFKKTLQKFLLDNSFYSMEEFFNFKEWGIFQIVIIQWHGVLMTDRVNSILQLYITSVIQQIYCVWLSPHPWLHL
jgi:hypothetical protein